MRTILVFLCVLLVLSSHAREAAGGTVYASRQSSSAGAPADVPEILRDLDEARSLRWCGITHGVSGRVVEGFAAEARLIGLLADVSSRPGDMPQETALSAAGSLMGAGRHAEALGILEAAHADSSSEDGLLMLALCLDHLGRRGEAAEAYGAYAARGGLLGDYALLHASRCLGGDGGARASLGLLRRLVARWKHSPLWGEAALELCESYLDLGNYGECIELAGRISVDARQGHQKRAALYLMARALEGAGRPDEAEPAYRRIVRDYPAHQKAGLAFRAFSRLVGVRGGELTREQKYLGGVALSKTGNLGEAYDVFEELLSGGATRPYWKEAVEEMAKISYKSKKYSDAAEKYQLLAEAGSMSSDEAGLWVGKCWIRSGREERAFEILKEVGKGEGARSIRAEALWEAGREMESQGRVAEASELYRFVADSIADAPLAPAACLRLGFCFYLMDNGEGALEALNKAHRLSGATHEKAQAFYWKAKVLEGAGRREGAEEALRQAASYGPGVYYGARAAWVLDTGMRELAEQEFVPRRATGSADTAGGSAASQFAACSDGAAGYPGRGTIPGAADPALDPAGWHFSRGVRLLMWGHVDEGAREIRAALESGGGKERAIAVLTFYGAYNQAMQVAGDAPPAHIHGSEDGNAYVAFPLGFAEPVWRRCAEAGIDPFLSLAIIRQESRFNPDAVSWAGAHGLMQLMPPTAKRHAARAGIRWRGPSQVFEPETNVRLGTMELHDLFEDLEVLPLVLAAYNAGPGKAKEWAALAEGRDLDSYIEMIGYSQTRDYVKLVIRDYMAFLRLYDPSWGPH